VYGLPKVIVSNQLNDGLTMLFCCGDKEYSLEYGKQTEIEVTADVYLYLDTVKKPI
jgi:hypothetical protein